MTKLLPEKEGQPRSMTVAGGDELEAGHWYSPAEVARLIAEEREACAMVCERYADYCPDDFDACGAYSCADAIRSRK